jgi:endonuclease/exonuclease/phosphatase family metal-dependent hydrolase
MPDRAISIITYNIHKGFSGINRRFVLPRMRAALANAGADIVFLQEAQGEHNRHAIRHPTWPDQSQFEFLADSLWPHFAYGKNAIYDDGHHGNAILSRYPFSHWENIQVSPYKLPASRSLLHGRVDIPDTDRKLHVICVHFGFLRRERRSQMRFLNERIAEHVPDGEPLIVAGDFNDWTGRGLAESPAGTTEVFQSLNGAYARTFPAWAPMLPMDRIYGRGLVSLSAERLTGLPWSMLSDHSPLQARFAL